MSKMVIEFLILGVGICLSLIGLIGFERTCDKVERRLNKEIDFYGSIIRKLKSMQTKGSGK